jgi:23S rRNA (uracil1939-C5)-methyltransferase
VARVSESRSSRPAPPIDAGEERHTVEVTAIAAGGAGVGRLDDGRVVFVHRTAPGDLVRIAVTEAKPRWVRGRLLRIERAGPDRREAPCPHYARCGGCTLEHLEYGAQRRAKAQLVQDALQRIGHLAAELPDVVAAPEEFRYRNRVSFTLLRLGAGRVVAGFHEIDRPNRITDIDQRCLLPEPAVARAWRGLRNAWGENASRLPAGNTLRLTLRATLTGEITLLVEGGYGDGRPGELLQRVPEIAAIWKGADEASPVLLAGSRDIRETWGGDDVQLGGSVFLQVNRAAAALLEQYVMECAGNVTGRHVIDAYCGVGLYAKRLTEVGARVTGIELDHLAVAETRRRCGNAVTVLEGRVEERLGDALPADLMIANPPRAGLDGRVTELLLHQSPPRLVYVSCDPATLARDLSRLAPRYTLRSLRCFDLFPQTAHVETVAELACATS